MSVLTVALLFKFFRTLNIIMAGRAIDLANRMIPQHSRLGLLRARYVGARMDQPIQQLKRPLMFAITARLVYLLPTAATPPARRIIRLASSSGDRGFNEVGLPSNQPIVPTK